MESTAKASTKYLEELSILLRNQGFIVHPRETRDIDVEHDGSTLCRINDLGNLGYQAIDIGHIDIEYEWYKKGAKKKVAIRGKAVNEAHDTSLEEESIEDCHYQNSIWKILH